MDGMRTAAREAADLIRAHGKETIHIVTHIDADALSAAGIAASSLDRAGIDYRVTYCKSLDDATLARLRDDPAPLTWYTDLGSAVHENLAGAKIITDHHEVPDRSAARAFPHVNPHVHGIEADDAISGAGCAYYVAAALDPRNADLSAMAIVGALGDLQDQRQGRLTGLNRLILADADAHGVVRAAESLRFYGRSTRPLPRFLRYADPPVPGIGDDEDLAVAFLVGSQVRVRDGERWRTFFDLDGAERERLVAALDAAYGSASVPRMRYHGEAYDLVRETEPELRCAKEFATLLNSTARYDEPEVGLALARGERGGIVAGARALLQGHRRSIGEAIQFAQRQGLARLGSHLAHFHAGSRIRDTILGIVAGILLGQGAAGVDRIVVGFADNRARGLKVSTRAPDSLVSRGANLSEAVSSAAVAVGGSGGGHAGAAGATIPAGTEAAFLARLSKTLDVQLSAVAAARAKATSL